MGGIGKEIDWHGLGHALSLNNLGILSFAFPGSFGNDSKENVLGPFDAGARGLAGRLFLAGRISGSGGVNPCRAISSRAGWTEKKQICPGPVRRLHGLRYFNH